MNDEEPAGVMTEGQDETSRRLRKLEAWVEVVMRTLATLGLESLLIELDEARGAHYELDEADESRAGGTAPAPSPAVPGT